jgi:molybdenum cofactor synthesis domain-containing protein
MKVAILTVSDRAASGQRPDRTGPALKEKAEQFGWAVVQEDVVPDEQPEIERRLIEWADSGGVDVIFTTGGTGFSPRDRTPEATLAVADRLAPGLGEAMRAASLRSTPHAMLSRAAAGIRGSTLIVNLPGSPTGAIENFEFLRPVLPHAIQLLQDNPEAEGGHVPPPHVGHA